jgi:phosphocarrier protein
MVTFDYTITDEVGIHARPAGLLVKEVKEYADNVTLSCNGKTADPKRLMALLALGVKKGDTVTLEVSGDTEAETAAKLEEFFKANLEDV